MRQVLRCIALVVWAVSVCGGAASGTPPPAPNPLEALRAAEVDGNVAAAIDRLEPYVSAHPKDAAAARMLGDLYFRNSDPDHAAAVWQAETRRMPDDLQTHERLGTLYAARNRLAAAFDEFERSLPLRGALLQLIDLQRRTKGLDAYAAQAQRGARENPDDPWQLTLYATVLQATQHADQALQYYTRVVDLAPLGSSCEARVMRAADLLDLKRGAEAIVDLRACLQHNANDYAALTMLGWTYLDARDYDQARPLLEHALVVLPQGTEALIDLGYLDDMTGEGDRAVRCYRQALAGDPLRPEAYINLGFDYAARRNYAEAEAVYAAGLTAAPRNGRLHYLLGAAYRSQGKFALAAAQFESALAADEADIANAARAALATLPNTSA